MSFQALLVLHQPENIELWNPEAPMNTFWDIRYGAMGLLVFILYFEALPYVIFSFHVSIFLFLFFFYALVFTFWLETKRFNSDNVVSLWLGSKTHEEIF